MRDTIPVRHDSLKEAKRQYRRAVIEAQRNRPDLHSLYKLGSALHEALGDAWLFADGPPDEPPESA